ncbi:MAG TPA: phage head closure protein [Burkholderiaceae bacterium]|nr:phage head closure protein [Burkholderiaceae bacterium]
MIDAGKLRERVTVQIASGTTNTMGETVLAWSNSTAVWASVEGVSARESLVNAQQEIAVTHRVRLRYLPGLTQNMRFAWRNRTLEIVSLLEHGNRSEHEAICQETA